MVIFHPFRWLIWAAAFGGIGVMMVRRGQADPHGLLMVGVGAAFVLIGFCGALAAVRGFCRAVRTFVG